MVALGFREVESCRANRISLYQVSGPCGALIIISVSHHHHLYTYIIFIILYMYIMSLNMDERYIIRWKTNWHHLTTEQRHSPGQALWRELAASSKPCRRSDPACPLALGTLGAAPLPGTPWLKVKGWELLGLDLDDAGDDGYIMVINGY